MYQLPCPHCGTSIEVPSTRAGEQTDCPSCGQRVGIPKLGDLRQLPRTSPEVGGEPVGTIDRESSFLARAGMVFLGLIGTAALLIAGYCGIRWFLLDVPASTETHLAMLADKYPELKAGELIREYEQMEEKGLELTRPYPYHAMQKTKDGWGRNAIIALVTFVLSAAIAFFLSLSGKRSQSSS